MAKNTNKTAANCLCGCGKKPKNLNPDDTARFLPGHDARFYAWALKVGDGRLKYADLPNDEARKNVKAAIAGKWREKAYSHGRRQARGKG